MFENSNEEEESKQLNSSKDEREQARNRYKELLQDYRNQRSKAKNAYDFYNILEKSVLEMEDDSSGDKEK